MSTKVVDCPRCYAINHIPVDLPIRRRVRCSGCRRSFRPPPVVPPQKSRRRDPGKARRKKSPLPAAFFLADRPSTSEARKQPPAEGRKRPFLPGPVRWLLALALLALLALLVGHPTLRRLLPGDGPAVGRPSLQEKKGDHRHP